jgi:MFS transporter, UMF1 family
MATANANPYLNVDESEYKRRIRAWTMYDWANSAFATTILAAVLPIYYSQVAGATLPSAAIATAYWSTGLSVSLFIVALMSPLLGTISDVMRGKKRFLAVFFGLGTISTGLLVLVQTGDWLLASILFVLGRIGFIAANVFYDALLPHVAREEDLDSVSARGFAMGYLGGGILLALNVTMIQFLPGTWGPRISFLSVAIWWAVFAIPLFQRIPEPPAATAKLGPGKSVISVSFHRLWDTLRDIRQYRELFKYLIAFLIYADGIGTIIGVAAIYGAELGFGSTELILALLLVQFVGIPYSLIFGRLPSPKDKWRPFYLAFVFYNMIALPILGLGGTNLLPTNVTGTPPVPYVDTSTAVGQGLYPANDMRIQYAGSWEATKITAAELRLDSDVTYMRTSEVGASYGLAFNGQEVTLNYSIGPDHGIWTVEMDGSPIVDEDTGQPTIIDAYNQTLRYGTYQSFAAAEPGEHVIRVVNSGEKSDQSQDTLLTFAGAEVLPPMRQSNLGLILGLIVIVELVGLLLSWLLGPGLFSGLAKTFTTQRTILLALVVYAVIAVWGFLLDSVIEFWCLAWMVAVVQGGSQALSRSLFSSMAPAAKSGEFFGLFGIMEKFSAIVGPLIFAFAAATFGSSRPAVLSIIAFFILGGFLLTRVNVEEGRRVARQEDAALLPGVEN